jgi:hypothetical protein
MDMEDQIKSEITVDEYAAKMGKDKNIVTLTFTVKSKLAADDLVTWFERGYDFVLDASVSDGEIEPGEYLVFVEIERRSKVPNRIINLLSDLETLTGIKLKDWIVEIEGDDFDADEEIIRKNMVLNPNEYAANKEIDDEKEKEAELNEVRNLAGIESPRPMYEEDSYIKNLKAMAGM